MSDTISGGSTTSGGGARATALTAALTLVLAGGVATAAYRAAQGGTDPATLIPSTAFAVATADLSLPGGQEAALGRILDRFPGSPTRSGSGSVRERLLRALFRTSNGQVDYDADIAPWLGDHVVIAGWSDSGTPRMEVLLQSRDDAAARTDLTKALHGHAQFVLHDGYAVVADTTGHVQDALAAAGSASLADTGPYANDVAGLPSDEAITAWFDGPAARPLLMHALPGFGGGARPMPGFGMFGMFGLSGAGGLLAERVAAGLRVADDYGQLDVREIGGKSGQTAPSSLVTDLPAGTVGAFEIGDPGGAVDGITTVVQSIGSFIGADVKTSCTGGFAVAPQPLKVRPPAAAIRPGTPRGHALLRRIRAAERRIRLARHHHHHYVVRSPEQLAAPHCTTHSTPPVDPLARIQEVTGLSLPADAKTLLGDGAVLSYGGLELGRPDIAIRSHPADIAAAQAVATKLSSHVSGSTGLQLSVKTSANDLIVATSAAYADAVAADGGLGDQSSAQAALGNVPGEVSLAGYVDFSKIWPLVASQVPDAVQHLKALGFWASRDGDVQHLQLRLVTG